MDDPSTMQIALGAGVGVVGVPFVVYRLMMAMKDLFPDLRDRAAVRAVYAVSAAIATLILIAAGAYAGVTWTAATVATAALAWIVFTAGIAEIAKGYYSNDHKVGIAGLPPSSEASVPAAAVNDPYATETRAPIAPSVMARLQDDAREMTPEERRHVNGGKR